MKSVKVARGKTEYFVDFDEAGAVMCIFGVAVVGNSLRYKSPPRRVAWSGRGWHVADGTPIPKQLQPIAEEALRLRLGASVLTKPD